MHSMCSGTRRDKKHMRDLVVTRRWLFRGQSQLRLKEHSVKISRSPYSDRLYPCCVKVLFFIALCLLWRSNPFELHLLTLKCCTWQELGSRSQGGCSAKQRSAAEWNGAACVCVRSSARVDVCLPAYCTPLVYLIERRARTQSDGRRSRSKPHKLSLPLLSINIREIIKEKQGTVFFIAIMTQCFRRLKINGAKQLAERHCL